MADSFKVSPFTSLNYSDGVVGSDYIFKCINLIIFFSIRNIKIKS